MKAKDTDSFLYRLGYAVSHFIFTTLYKTRVYGAENIPKEGGFLLACNHASFFDPFVAGCFLERPLHFFARDTLFNNRVGAWFLNGFNAVPVSPTNSDPASLIRILRLVKAGRGLLIFPEGTRSYDGNFLPAKKGVGMIACRTGAPVVPLHIVNSHAIWPRGKKIPSFGEDIFLVYGKPIYPEEYDPGKESVERYQEASDFILEKIKALKPSYRETI